MDKLVKAIKKGDAEKVGELLQDPACNLNELDSKTGKSLLQIAMENDEAPIVRMLLNMDAINLNLLSKGGEMLLETAILVNSVEYVELLMKKKPNPKLKNGKGESAMNIAVKNNINCEILKKLILNNFDVNEKISEYGSLLNLAIVSNQLGNFRQLLEHPGINIKVLDDEENTPLVLATKLKMPDFIVLILEKLKSKIFSELETQFFLNHQNEDGNTALHIASMKDFQTITELLLREGKALGLDPDLKNKEGRSYEYFIEKRKEEARNMAENERRKKEEKIVKKKQKDEERQRQQQEEEMLRVAKKKQQKEQELRAALELKEQRETTQSKRLWTCGIFIVALLGIVYLLMLNAIPQSPR